MVKSFHTRQHLSCTMANKPHLGDWQINATCGSEALFKKFHHIAYHKIHIPFLWILFNHRNLMSEPIHFFAWLIKAAGRYVLQDKTKIQSYAHLRIRVPARYKMYAITRLSLATRHVVSRCQERTHMWSEAHDKNAGAKWMT